MKERIWISFVFQPSRPDTCPPLQEERGCCCSCEPNVRLSSTSFRSQTEYGHPGNFLLARGGDRSCVKSGNTVQPVVVVPLVCHRECQHVPTLTCLLSRFYGVVGTLLFPCFFDMLVGVVGDPGGVARFPAAVPLCQPTALTLSSRMPFH